MANEIIARINDNWMTFNGIDTDLANYIGNFGTHPADNAFRFLDITIPNGATIDFARLVFKFSGAGDPSGLWKFNVWGMDQDNTTAFSSNPLSRPKTSASRTFDEDEPDSGDTFSFSVTSILNEIVARGGWSSGNAVGFIIEDDGSDDNIYGRVSFSQTYLTYRVSASPNFTPTPVTVSAPSLPEAADVGMKFSKLGVSVLEATDSQLISTTRKRFVKNVVEDIITSSETGITVIPHNLGYMPLVTVYCLRYLSPAWIRLPYQNPIEDTAYYFADEDNLYIYSTEAGEQFYYRILLDRVL